MFPSLSSEPAEQQQEQQQQQPLNSHRRVQAGHVVLILIAVCCACVTATYFMDHHQMYERSGGGCSGVGLHSNGPSRHDPVKFTLTSETHSKYHHSGNPPLLFLGGLLALCLWSWRRPKHDLEVATTLAFAYLGLLVSLFDLDHMSGKTRNLPGKAMFATAMVALFCMVATYWGIRYNEHRAEKRRRAGPGLPEARLTSVAAAETSMQKRSRHGIDDSER